MHTYLIFIIKTTNVKHKIDLGKTNKKCSFAVTQSEIYRQIFDNYGGTSGKIFHIYRGHYVGEVQILNV